MLFSKKKYMLICLPAILLIIFIYASPIINTFYTAFIDYYSQQFAGFNNFIRLSNIIWPLVVRTFTWTFGSVIPAMIIGLFAAMLYQENFRGKQFWLVLSLTPYCMPLVIVATLWNGMYDPMYGLINTFLLEFGILDSPIVFLSRQNAMISVIIARIWRAAPFAFIAYYAGLKSIPEQLYEAAKIDGANFIQQFFFITLPQLKPVTLTTGLILMIWTTLVFDIIYTMTGGGPVRATRILPIEIYQQFMVIGNRGVAAALSLVTILILLVLSSLYFGLMKGGEN